VQNIQIHKLQKEEKAMSTLKETIEKIKNLETEKKNLLDEIDGLKKMAEAKAMTLETEVASLREDAKSLKILMAQGQEPPSANRLKIS
jgi:uncharacterized protein (UPF0335 family)